MDLSAKRDYSSGRHLRWLDSAAQLHPASTSFSVLQNSVLTAQWTPTPITITYALNNGTSTTPTQSNLFYHNTFQVAQTPTRTGYTFAGWSDGTATYAPGQSYVVGTSNITLTAQWNVNSYAVTYDKGIGQGTLPTQSNTAFGATFTLSSTTPTLAGYTFNTWSDGTNLYAPGSTYTMGTGDVTLSAQYSPLGYTTITYLLNNGTGTTPLQTALPEGSYFTVANASTLACVGYQFNAWSDGAATYQPGYQYYVGSYLNPISLTAEWTPVFSITYSVGSGTGTVPTDSTQYLTSDAFTVASGSGLTQNGYSFNGWSDGTSIYQPGDYYTVGNNNITLTAVWLAISNTTTAPAPDPVQQSTIMAISPSSAITGAATPTVITGAFVERVANIAIDNYFLPIGSWIQTASTVSFEMPNLPLGTHLIQIYNGSAPVLTPQIFTVVAPSIPITPANPANPPVTPSPTPVTTPPTGTASSTSIPAQSSSTSVTPTHVSPLRSNIALKIYFDLGSYAINSSNLGKLQNLSSRIAGLGKEITITITGYAQPTPGSQATDGLLSQRRAAQVARILRENGVTTRVIYAGAGRAAINAPSSRYVEIVASNR